MTRGTCGPMQPSTAGDQEAFHRNLRSGYNPTMNQTLSRRTFIAIIGILATISALVGLQAYRWTHSPNQARPDIPGLLWPNPRPMPEFSLVDQHGDAFTAQRLTGRWTFLFFGYSHCPDVCPVTLSVMNELDKILKEAPQASYNAQFAFVSVDPARDTPEHLGGYVEYFNKDFLGLTGDESSIEKLTRSLGIVYQREPPDENGNYTVDHTASILLSDPQRRFVAVFGAPHDARVIARRFEKIRAFLAE